ncbi:MAG TPA: NAD(P)H-dependent oxidoreductase [Azospirillaceae bacterium]|nr:NAD(P)H-dependent oxidoreductase [Azospirillaceae bacterium]
MADSVRILGISGSLRKGSYNTAALNAAIHLCPEGVTIEVFDIAAIPLYNEDVREQGLPDPVQRFRDRLAASDAVLFVSPEYNYSMPGVLKNAIDWASRPPNPPFDGKPVAIMGASPGMLGTARMQYHLRQSLVFLNALPVNKPEVMISNCGTKFDAEGNLTDAKTREMITRLLTALADWTRRLRRGSGG